MSKIKEQLENIEWDLHEQPQQEEQKPEFEKGIKPFEFGIEETQAKNLTKGLLVSLAERDLLDKEFEIVSKLEMIPENIIKFRELRIKYQKNRTQGTNKWHEIQSEVPLRLKQFLDATKRAENSVNESRESVLMNGEKFIENEQKEKARLLNLERISRIEMYVVDTTGLDFSEMNDYDFDDYVLGKKTRFENEAKAKKEAEELAEKERLAEIERQRLIEVENAKLRKEAEEKEVLLQKERAETARIAKLEADKQAKIQADKDAEIKKEREAKEKLEAEIKAKKAEQEQSEAKAKLEAEKLSKAPIKNQLSVWVNSFEIPSTNIDNEVSKEIKEKFEAFKKWSINKINNL